MKIWLINNYNTLPEHGQFTRNYNFAMNLVKMGHQPTCFVGSHPHNTDMQLIDDGGKYKIFSKKPFPWVLIKTNKYGKSKIKRVISMFEFYKNMMFAAKDFERPDVIVGSSAHPLAAVLAIKLGRKYGCKKIVEIRDLWPESIVAYGIAKQSNPIVRVLRRLEKWIYKNADSIVFTMDGAYDYIKEQGWEAEIPKSKVCFINNGIELKQFDYRKEKIKINDPDLSNKSLFKVCYAGSIRRANHIDFLLDVAKHTKNKKIVYLIWGDGEELEMLRQRRDKDGIDNVIFKGRVEKKYIPYIVSNVDANFIDPFDDRISKYGISSNKLFEYIRAEKPILMNDVGKYNPVKDYCFIYDSDSVKTAKMIEELANISNKQKDRIAANLKNVSEKYSFENLTKDLLDCINGYIKQ